MRRPTGLLVIDKPQGLTSFDVVRAVRRRLGGVKAGHTGTLDPLATGVLPICLGDATRIASLLLAEDKRYETTAQLGLETDTLDITGKQLASGSCAGVERAAIESLLGDFVGPQEQMPPAFSALKIGGKRAHELARRGEAVVLAPRPIVIHSLELLSWEPPQLRLRIHCGKGTYIRSLVADLGRALGCGATVAALRRLSSGCFTLAQSVSVDALGQLPDEEIPLLSIDQALAHLPLVQVDETEARAVGQGQRGVRREHAPDAPLVRVRLAADLIGLAELRDGQLRPRTIFDAERWQGDGQATVPGGASLTPASD